MPVYPYPRAPVVDASNNERSVSIGRLCFGFPRYAAYTDIYIYIYIYNVLEKTSVKWQGFHFGGFVPPAVPHNENTCAAECNAAVVKNDLGFSHS